MATTAEEVQYLIELDNDRTVQEVSVELPAEEKIKHQLEILKESDQDKLVKITITKEIFQQIRKSLQDTVKSMEKNPSIFSRAADYWGQLPLWQKIIGGAVLTLPTLILGIVAHVGFLLAICGVTAVTYTAGGIILDDHHKCSTSAVESLQKGILGLADLLELTINALDVIREQLAVEIQRFVKENARLTENIEHLSTQIDLIDQQVMATAKLNGMIGETKDGLVAVADVLREGVAEQTDLMKQNQEKLARITETFHSTKNDLEEKVREVTLVKDELGNELQRAKSLIEALHSAISQLAITAIDKEAQRKAFLEKLDIFINDKEASFLLVFDRICEAERKLAVVQKELENSNQRYQELLLIQEKHIDTLKILSTQSSPEQASPIPPVSELLSRKGFYAVKDAPNNSQELQEQALTL